MILGGWNYVSSLMRCAFRTPIDNPPHKAHKVADELLKPVRSILQHVGKGGVPVSVDLETRSFKQLPCEEVTSTVLAASALVYIPCAALGALGKLISLCDPEFRDAIEIIAGCQRQSAEPTAAARPLLLQNHLARELSKRILSQLDPVDLVATGGVCRLWREVIARDPAIQARLAASYPASLLRLRNFLGFGHAKVAAHRAGTRGKQLLQAVGSNAAPTPLINMVSTDLLHGPVTHLKDPWGRCAVALRYVDADGVASVLVLHQVHSGKQSLWTAGQAAEGCPIYAFFPQGWNHKPQSLDYLRRLLAGEPCGHASLNEKHQVVESEEREIRLI